MSTGKLLTKDEKGRILEKMQKPEGGIEMRESVKWLVRDETWGLVKNETLGRVGDRVEWQLRWQTGVPRVKWALLNHAKERGGE